MNPPMKLLISIFRSVPRFCCLLLLLGILHPQADAQEVRLQQILKGERLDRPVHLAEVPDGSRRMVVVEQPGRIKIFAPEAGKSSGRLLDIRKRVSTEGWDSGLLSVAFHPEFQKTRHFYVYYSAASPRRSVLSRFTAARESLGALAGSERVLLEVPQPYANHNGGQIAFGPDGYLYIGLGDGGSGGDPMGNGQNPRTLLGTILRIDVNRGEGGRPYAIPRDNPFVGARDGRRAEIWAFGLRNPWRFSFDRKTGELYAADVGQDAMEEINLIFKGANYGWNVLEGTRCFKPRRGCAPIGMAAPISEYTHRVGQSVTGGFLYRGRGIPKLRGRYVFGDFMTGRIWSIPGGMGGMRLPKQLLKTRLSISSFGEDGAGELYVADLKGYLFKLVRKP